MYLRTLLQNMEAKLDRTIWRSRQVHNHNVILTYFPVTAAAAAKSPQSCPTLCDPIDGSPPGSPIPGILRQEHWSGFPFPSLMRESEVAQLCPIPSDPMGRSPPGSSVHGIFQARVLEWAAIAFSESLTWEPHKENAAVVLQ